MLARLLQARWTAQLAAALVCVLAASLLITLACKSRPETSAAEADSDAGIAVAIMGAAEQPPRSEVSQDEEQRRRILGVWQDEYQGKRTKTLRADGSGTMIVELSGVAATLVAPKLTFEMEWLLADGRITMRSLRGEPAAKVEMILKAMGDQATYQILELTDDRLLLLDADGKTKYDWRRAEAQSSANAE